MPKEMPFDFEVNLVYNKYCILLSIWRLFSKYGASFNTLHYNCVPLHMYNVLGGSTRAIFKINKENIVNLITNKVVVQ